MKLRTLILASCLFSGGLTYGQVFEDVITDDLVQEDARFGSALDTDGEWMAVGSQDWDDHDQKPDSLFNIGLVSLFKQINNEWVFQTSVHPEFRESQISGWYASSVSLWNGYLFVGSPLADPITDRNSSQDASGGDILRSGRVRVYHIDAGGSENWGLVQIIETPDPTHNARFGTALDSIDDLLVIGETRYNGNEGRTHIYKLDDASDTWQPNSILYPIEECHTLSRRFGSSVAIERNGESEYSMIVGSPGSRFRRNCPGDNPTEWQQQVGAVHFYRTLNGTWNDLNVIPNPRFNGIFGEGEQFGSTVDLSNGYAVASAPEEGEWIFNDDHTNAFYSRHGEITIFEYNPVINQWETQQEFFPFHRSDIQKSFGAGLVIQNDLVIASARNGNHIIVYGRHSGGGYNTWGEVASLPVPDSVGISPNVTGRISLLDEYAYIGAPGTDIGGAVVSLNLQAFACRVDLNRDTVLNFGDVSIFLDAYLAHDRTGDFNGDGYWNFFDLTDFIDAVVAGCP